MTYQIEFTASAGRALSKFGKTLQFRITAKIDALANQPRPPGVEKLHGRRDRYRLRVGDYRIIYEIQDCILLVLIVDIGHRREIYR